MSIHRVLKRAQKTDPYLIRKAFIAHYLNIPFHELSNSDTYPRTLIEELFAASIYLIRSFELSPFRTDDLEDLIAAKVNNENL